MVVTKGLGYLKGRKKTQREVFTIMVVPHSGKKTTFSVSIPIIVFKILGGILTVTLIATVLGTTFFSKSYKEIRTNAEQLTFKVRDYDYLQKQLDIFVRKTKDLETKVRDIEKLDKDLRGLLQDDPELKDKLDTHDNEDDTAFKEDVPDTAQTAVLLARMRTNPVISDRGTVDREQALKELGELVEQMPEREESLKELKDAVIQRNSRLACTPSIWPVSGTVTSSFGYRRSPFGSRTEFHDGLDIGANYGAKVSAAADGVVTFTGYISGYGNTVRISHGYGFETSYCHNSKILVKSGQQIKKGQAIAQVGSTGRSTGPHLHYMVKVNGVLKNPREFTD